MNRTSKLLLELEGICQLAERHGVLEALLEDDMINDVLSHALGRNYSYGTVYKAVERAWIFIYSKDG